MRRTQAPPGNYFVRPNKADFNSQLGWRQACLRALHRAWKQYDKEHETNVPGALT